MYDAGKDTAITHNTMNPVPCILVSPDSSLRLKPVGSAADIAPTLLELMGLECPKDMTGKSLIER